MGDTIKALELSGLAQIGRGETSLNIFEGIRKTIKVNFNKLDAKGRSLKKRIQRFLYPAENLFHQGGNSEFTDSDSWPFLPPLDRGLKTKLGIYLDALTKNNPPNTAVYFDNKMNIYIQDKNNSNKYRVYKTTNGIIEDAGDFDYIEPDFSIKVKSMESEPLSKTQLQEAEKVVERQLRALQRDAERTYTGKKVTFKDENPFSLPEYDKQLVKMKVRAQNAGITRPINLQAKGERLEKTLEKTRKLKGGLNFNAFELLNDAAKYEEWIHNGGASKDLTGYEIQDIENQIKAIKALSNDKIRKISINVINKALKGEDLSFTSLYNDIQRISGIGPLQISADMLRLKSGDVRDTAEVYDDLVKEIAKYSPTTKRIFADQATGLAAKAALGASLKYIPKVGGFISGIVSAVGGSVGLLSNYAVETIFILAALCYRFVRNRRITEETKEKDERELSRLMSTAIGEMSKMMKQSEEKYEKLLKKVLDDRKNERITSDEVGLARARIEYQKTRDQISSDVLKESQNILSRKMPPKLASLEYSDDGKKVTLHYYKTKNGKKISTRITSPTIVSRSIVDDYKEKNSLKMLAIAVANHKNPTPEMKIAFIEKYLNTPVNTIDRVAIQDVVINPPPNNLIPLNPTNNVFELVNDPTAIYNYKPPGILNEISAFTADVIKEGAKEVVMNKAKAIVSDNIKNILPAPPPAAPPFTGFRKYNRKRPIIEEIHEEPEINNFNEGSEFEGENVENLWDFNERIFFFLFFSTEK